MEENKKKNLMRQIIRFAFVGGSAFVIDYGDDLSDRADRNQLSDFQRNFIFGFGYLQLYFECTLGI